MPSPRRHLSVDEFSHRASTGLAIRRGDIKISDPIPSSYIHNGPEMDYDAAAGQSTTTRAEGAWPRRSTNGAAHGRSESGTQLAHVSRFTEKTSPPMNTTNNMPSILSQDAPLQRSGSGFRATLRRMFSKKDKAATLQKRPIAQSNQSQPLTSIAAPVGQTERPLLSSHNISRSDALHSHAVSPMLDTASDFSATQESNFGQLGGRRNTVPSLSLLQEFAESPTLRADTPTISQRPRTATRRTSPLPAQYKRRSRSADALADLLRSPQLSTSYRQDRTEEIAYWRNSVLDNPLPQLTERRVLGSFTASEPTERPDTSPARPPRPSIEPVQDFDFGLNESEEPARPTTLQERVNTLEVKLFDFEYALAKLQGSNITKPDVTRRASAGRSIRDLSTPDNFLPATESSSNTDSPRPSKPDHFSPPTTYRDQRNDRGSKGATNRPTHRRNTSSRSQASSPRSIHLSTEQYDMLYNLIKDERVARQQLESQILQLQKEIESLKSPMYSGPVKYPTPSPDSLRNQPVIATRPRPLHHSPAQRALQPNKETSRFSTTETESETDADEIPSEVYATPQENTFRFETRAFNPIHNMI